MCKQAKDRCTWILLYIFITCANALSCYSCYGGITNALDCETIDCEASLLDEPGIACYYMSKSDYQRRGCENIQSLLSQHLKNNYITLHYCGEDYCNGYSDVFLNDSRRQYQSKETQATDLKSSWNTLDSHLPSTGKYNRPIQSTISKTDLTLLIAAISVTILIVACVCFCKKAKKPQNKSGSRIVYNSQGNHYNQSSHDMDTFFYADNFASNAMSNHSFLNNHSAILDTDFKHCDEGDNDHSGINCHVGGSSHHNDYGGAHYSYTADYCSSNDFGGGGGGDDCGGGGGGHDSGGGGGDCGGGDCGGGDCGGGD